MSAEHFLPSWKAACQVTHYHIIAPFEVLRQLEILPLPPPSNIALQRKYLQSLPLKCLKLVYGIEHLYYQKVVWTYVSLRDIKQF